MRPPVSSQSSLRAGAGALLGRGGIGIEDADGVDFDVGLADLGADFALGVAGTVVAAVGDHQQGLALVAASFIFSTP